MGGRFLFHAEASRGLCARGHEATEKVVILYIYTHTHGYAGLRARVQHFQTHEKKPVRLRIKPVPVL
jgi:hypothetical protein